MTQRPFKKDLMFYRFALYGFLKNLRVFEPFILLFFREGGLSFLQIGVLYSVRDLATNLLEIPAGVFADAFGRRKSMVLSFSAYIGSFVLFYAVPHFYAYALAMLGYAVGEAFRTGTHKALILEHLNLNNLREYKVAYYGQTRAASQLGSAVNALLAAALVFYTGSFRYVFIVSIIPYVLDLLNLATYPPELDGELVQLQKGTAWKQIKTTTLTFLRLFKDPHAMRAILNSSGFDAFFKATKDYLQPILEAFAFSLPLFVVLVDEQRTALIIGSVYFGIFLLSSYASRSAGRVGARFKDVAQAINVTFLSGAGLLLIAGLASAWSQTWLSILVFLGLYLLHNIRRPLNVAFISDQIASRVMAAGLSVESQFTTLLMVVLAPALGALADAFGVSVALTALGVGMALLALLTRVTAPASPATR